MELVYEKSAFDWLIALLFKIIRRVNSFKVISGKYFVVLKYLKWVMNFTKFFAKCEFALPHSPLMTLAADDFR